jgi:hypothetical protein
MPHVHADDGTRLHCEEPGQDPPLIFVHRSVAHQHAGAGEALIERLHALWPPAEGHRRSLKSTRKPEQVGLAFEMNPERFARRRKPHE